MNKSANTPDKPTILIVDDVPDNLSLMNGVLKDLYNIKIANSGEHALKVVQTGAPPDIILLDIMMPEMDGYEVCRRLKSNKKTSDIPVIFVTAKDQEEDEAKGFKIGAVDYITKPISPVIVRARVKTHISLRNTQQRLQDLLKKTLSGSIQVLVDILELVNPTAFSRSSRIRRILNGMVKELELPDAWRYDLAGMLSQIGCVTIPPDTLNHFHQGLELSEAEKKLCADLPKVGSELIANIPHLDQVAWMIARQNDPFDENEPEDFNERDPVVLGGQLLKIVTRYVHSISSGMSENESIIEMKKQKNEYDPNLVRVLAKIVGVSSEKQEEKMVTANTASKGMIIDQDVYSDDGVLIIVKGTELSMTTVKILQQYGQLEKIKGFIRVLAPKDETEAK
jgi:response regulator RpfG family c-di-GMP phosphodiesterase